MCVDLASATCLPAHADNPHPASGSPASTLDLTLRSHPIGSRTPAQVPTLAFTPVFLYCPSSTRLSPSDAASAHSYSSQLASRAPSQALWLQWIQGVPICLGCVTEKNKPDSTMDLFLEL